MRIGIIGGGVMGAAFVKSLVGRRVLAASDILCSDVSHGALHTLEQEFGVRTTDDNERVVDECDIVLLCVKPQVALDVTAPLRARVRPEQVFVSIMAGVSLAALRHGLGTARVVRAMPNTPAQVGEGMTVWISGPAVPPAEHMIARMLFQSFGHEMEVFDERLLDAATAVSGSGPAYVFFVAEMMIAAARELGFDAAQAERLVRRTFRGSVDLWESGDEPPERLRLNVTSKGGTTHAAMECFEQRGTRAIFTDALRAAFVRAGELREAAEPPPPPRAED